MKFTEQHIHLWGICWASSACWTSHLLIVRLVEVHSNTPQCWDSELYSTSPLFSKSCQVSCWMLFNITAEGYLVLFAVPEQAMYFDWFFLFLEDVGLLETFNCESSVYSIQLYFDLFPWVVFSLALLGGLSSWTGTAAGLWSEAIHCPVGYRG